MHTRFSTQQAANMVDRICKRTGWDAEIAHLDIHEDPTESSYETWKVVLKRKEGWFSVHKLIANDEGTPGLVGSHYHLNDAVQAMLKLKDL